jgi:hypothetical protein
VSVRTGVVGHVVGLHQVVLGFDVCDVGHILLEEHVSGYGGRRRGSCRGPGAAAREVTHRSRRPSAAACGEWVIPGGGGRTKRLKPSGEAL